MKKTILYLTAIVFIFIACEKEYIPDEDAYRDSNLIGTWKSSYIIDPNDSSGLFVFTQDGYAESTYWINNDQLKGFKDLSGLWHNITEPDEKGIGKFYHASIYKHWTNGRWEKEKYYRVIGNQDTLLLGSEYNKLTDTLIWNSYQLKYNGPKYVSIDSIN
jgi:hypothetical protein